MAHFSRKVKTRALALDNRKHQAHDIPPILPSEWTDVDSPVTDCDLPYSNTDHDNDSEHTKDPRVPGAEATKSVNFPARAYYDQISDGSLAKNRHNLRSADRKTKPRQVEKKIRSPLDNLQAGSLEDSETEAKPEKDLIQLLREEKKKGREAHEREKASLLQQNLALQKDLDSCRQDLDKSRRAEKSMKDKSDIAIRLLENDLASCKSENTTLEENLVASRKALESASERASSGTKANFEKRIRSPEEERDAPRKAQLDPTAQDVIQPRRDDHPKRRAPLEQHPESRREDLTWCQANTDLRELANEFSHETAFGRFVDTVLLPDRARKEQHRDKQAWKKQNAKFCERNGDKPNYVDYPLADPDIFLENLKSYASVISWLEGWRLDLKRVIKCEGGSEAKKQWIKICQAQLDALKEVAAKPLEEHELQEAIAWLTDKMNKSNENSPEWNSSKWTSSIKTTLEVLIKARSEKTTGNIWNKSFGEGYYAICVKAVHVNRDVHPPMTKNTLENIKSRADQGAYARCVKVDMNNIIKEMVLWVQKA